MQKVHMLYRLMIVFLTAGFLFPISITAQDTISSADTSRVFPHSWQGKWRGNLEVFTAKGLAQSVPMELHILPIENTNNFTWTIIYGEDKESGKRPYELQSIDPENGIYLIDEKNSIKMEAYYFAGKLFSRFEVMGNLLLSTVEKHEDHLIFEIISGKLDPVSTTGAETVEGEEIPEVKAYPVGVRQRGVLDKT